MKAYKINELYRQISYTIMDDSAEPEYIICDADGFDAVLAELRSQGNEWAIYGDMAGSLERHYKDCNQHCRFVVKRVLLVSSKHYVERQIAYPREYHFH